MSHRSAKHNNNKESYRFATFDEQILPLEMPVMELLQAP